MKNYHLAIDIGASSGRHILGYIENGKLALEEVYRFENYITDENKTLVWDIKHLVDEVKKGIAKCKEVGKIPSTIAIDTWGVDYVLLDENKQEIMPAVSYRDSRTFAAMDEVAELISQEELYARTGIQKQNYNTIYQLYCDKQSGKLERAKHVLMMPSYLSFKLTGVIKNEYTHASTTNLVNAETKTWDFEILDKLGINKDIFSDLSLPCTEVGSFTEEVKREVGFDSKVIFCPSHDTASAVAACNVGDNGMYISSGTWSLIGTENLYPVLSKEAFEANFANEGGINYRFRFLKNIMGMWLFQNVRKNLNKQFSYDDMMNMAMQSGEFEIIDTNAADFLAPDNMIEAIRGYLKNEKLPIEIVINTIYHSLAKSYANAVKEIEKISGKTIDTINIVGGGSKDGYLNELTKQYTGKRVLAGPVEATATGNIISQMMFVDKKLTLEKAREFVKNSFDITEVM
ncbi:MAG: rhamnulokinase [Eubacterium sp.]|nr:rhamnulokinase [Eubacterium sp.]